MTDLVMDHHGDASPDFITGEILHDRHLMVKYWDGGLIKADIANLSPRLIVVKAKREMKQYNKEPSLYPVYKLVCMDGSETLVRAQTDTRLSKFLRNNDTIMPGTTLILKEYVWLAMDSPGQTYRRIILIKQMTWRHPPHYNLACVRSGLTPSPPQQAKKQKTEEEDPKLFRLSWRALHKAERECLVVFTHPVLDQPDKYIWNKMTNVEAVDTPFVNGIWIHDTILREQWMTEWDPKKWLRQIDAVDSEEESYPDDGLGPFRTVCECQTVHQFEKCIMHVNPVHMLCHEALFWAGRNRCVRQYHDQFESAEDWEGLPNNCKRWCCYFWYAVNIFQIRGECKELPPCVVRKIRDAYPNAHGRNYVGYKSKEERGGFADV